MCDIKFNIDFKLHSIIIINKMYQSLSFFKERSMYSINSLSKKSRKFEIKFGTYLFTKYLYLYLYIIK